MNNTKTILFRASGVGALMVDPRSKADRESGVLSETAKSFVREQWLYNEYRYSEPIVTPQMFKGLICEQDAIEVVSDLIPCPEFRVKNVENFVNDFFTGTPDVVLQTEGIVEDVKCSWTLKTFMNASVSKLYYAQLQVYMNLTKATTARLIYVLVDTPETILKDEMMRLSYKFNNDDDNPYYLDCLEKLMSMHHVDHIPEEKRMKVFEFDYDPEFIEELQTRVEKAREYYNSLKL